MLYCPAALQFGVVGDGGFPERWGLLTFAVTFYDRIESRLRELSKERCLLAALSLPMCPHPFPYNNTADGERHRTMAEHTGRSCSALRGKRGKGRYGEQVVMSLTEHPALPA